MFGLSFFEIMILAIVGIVVVGPRKLPRMLKTTGQWIAKIRNMSRDLQSQAGIDEIVREEGIEKEIREIRSLTRGNVLNTLVDNAMRPRPARALPPKSTSTNEGSATTKSSLVKPAGSTVASGRPSAIERAMQTRARTQSSLEPVRDREYPTIGCDSYGALPDDIDDPDTYASDPEDTPEADGAAAPEDAKHPGDSDDKLASTSPPVRSDSRKKVEATR